MAKPKSKGNPIWELIKTIFYALLIAGIFRSLAFQPFWIPSGSMKNTLLIGDFLFVNKMAYGYSYASCPSVVIPSIGINIDAQDVCGFLRNDNKRLFGETPERGDVVVFRHPITGRDFIKRVVGLPGDRIQMREGVLFINGNPVEQADAGIFKEPGGPQGPHALPPRCSNGTVGTGAICQKKQIRETFPNGHAHMILDIGNQASDSTPVYTVPDGHLFFMGDNRDNSSDSRIPQQVGGVGFVPMENLVGRADRVIFSSAGTSMLAFWTWRIDRFFKGIE